MVYLTCYKLCHPQSPGHGQGCCSQACVTGGEIEGTEFYSEHLLFRSQKSQNELEGWVWKAASQPIWFLQLPPTTPTRTMELVPSIPNTQEVCRTPRGKAGLWVFQGQEHDSIQTPWMSALVSVSSFFKIGV